MLKIDEETSERFNTKFARLFGPDNRYWSSNPEYNEVFLRMQENFMNDQLAARGHVFLNEIYDMLGFPRVPDGQILGWIHDDGQTIVFRTSPNDDGSIMIEINVSSAMTHHKI